MVPNGENGGELWLALQSSSLAFNYSARWWDLMAFLVTSVTRRWAVELQWNKGYQREEDLLIETKLLYSGKKILQSFIKLPRHTVVCCADQENGAHANRVSILTGTTNSRFSRIRSSMMLDPNGIKFIMKVPSTKGRPHSNFKEDSFGHSWDKSNQTFKKNFFPPFCTLCINCYNSCMHAEI